MKGSFTPPVTGTSFALTATPGIERMTTMRWLRTWVLDLAARIAAIGLAGCTRGRFAGAPPDIGDPRALFTQAAAEIRAVAGRADPRPGHWAEAGGREEAAARGQGWPVG